jgi:ATP-binding cassette subfamily B protein
MSRGAEDINSIRRFLMFSMRMFIYGVTMIVAVSVILFRADGSLAFMALAVVPLLVITSVRFGRIVRPQFLNVQQQFGDMSSVLQENLAGTRVVRVFAAEQREITKFEKSLTDLFDWQMSAVKVWSRYFPAMTMLNELAIAFILWYGGRQVLSGDLSVGTLIAFNLYMVLLMMPVRSLGFIINSLARAIASGERIFEILDLRPPIRSKDDAIELRSPRGAVRFENVSFRYPNTEPLVLNHIDIEATPGKIIALFGPTGSGKSTVTALLQRFYDVTDGSVTFDGYDVRDLELTSLRRAIGVVPQDSFLFGATIRENIAFGNPEASDAAIEQAARIANAHDFIMQQAFC